jgi:hypothetical protein
MKRYHGFVFLKNDVLTFFKIALLMVLTFSLIQLTIYLGLVNIFIIEKNEWVVIIKYITAKIISNILPDYKILFTNSDGSTVMTTAHMISNNDNILQMMKWVWSESRAYLILSSSVHLLLPIGFFLVLKSDSKKKNGVHIRGTKLMTTKQFHALTRKKRDRLDLPFGSVSMPVSSEEKSTLITGIPGSGKTTLLSGIFCRLNDKGTRLIVYDYKGDYVQKFFNPKKDYIFNVLDPRGISWNLFNEIATPMDIDAIASSLIPDIPGSTSDRFWNDGGRDVFGSCLYCSYSRGIKQNSDIWRMVSSEGKTLANLLKKTPGCEKGYKYIADHKSKQALSILAVVMQYCSCFQYMPDGDNNFSINDWIENGTGNIFITNNAGVQDTLKPLLSLFIDLLARKFLSMPDNRSEKKVLLLDEFTTLNNLPSLVNLLTLGRSKGVSCYIGTQSFGQIENIYGKAHKESIINSCANKAIFSMSDSATAKYCSDLIGEAESVRGEKSLSLGSDYREGASLSYRHNTEPVVLTSEIMNLNDLEFIVKFANYPPVKSRLKYTDYPKKQEGFIMRSDLKIKKYVRPSKQKE